MENFPPVINDFEMLEDLTLETRTVEPYCDKNHTRGVMSSESLSQDIQETQANPHEHNQVLEYALPERTVLSKTKPRLEPVVADYYRDQLAKLQNPNAVLDELRITLPTQLKAARGKAEKIADVLLTPSWCRMIGRATRLVRTLLIQILETREVYDANAEHCFATYDDLARAVGVSKRTIERWLSPTNPGAQWLECWIQKRATYGRRSDGLPCVMGTVFRVATTVRQTNDLTPSAKPRLEALKAPWRLQLPADEGFFSSGNDRQKNAVCKTFQKGQECFSEKPLIKVEGRDVCNILSIPLSSNDRQKQNHIVAYRSGLSSALHESALGNAKSLAEKMGDVKSEVFYYKLFRRAALGQIQETQIWAAASEGLNAQSAGLLTRGTAAGYMVGVLKRAGLQV